MTPSQLKPLRDAVAAENESWRRIIADPAFPAHKRAEADRLLSEQTALLEELTR